MSESDESEMSDDSGCMAESEIFAAVRHARSTLAAGAFTEALALLLNLVAEAPSLGAVLESEILAALQGATVGRSPTQAAYLYSGLEKALPQSVAVAVAHGGRLHSDGEHLAALKCFERAMKIDPTNAPAQEGLENLRSFAAERWHFRMVNDRLRNSTYNAAICRAVEAWRRENAGNSGDAGPTVLDVGAGTGVLSLMAARAGAGPCWGVEVNSLLCSIARATVAQPSHALFSGGPVHILNAHSSDLTCATKSLPKRCADRNNSGSAVGRGCLPEGGFDMVVTELVDSGLVGEHILAVLRHARQSLLKPGGRIVPQAATLYARPVSSPALRLRLQLLDDMDATEAAIEADVEVASNTAVANGAAHKHESFWEVPNSCIRRLHGLRCESLFPSESTGSSSTSGSGDQCGVVLDEQYTCEDLGWFPHTPLANWAKALDLDFAEICRSDFVTSACGSTNEDAAVLQSVVPLAEKCVGRVDAIAVCFRLILDRGENISGSDCNDSNASEHEISFDTFPGRQENGWDQGIYPLASSNHFVTDSATTLRTILDAHDRLSFHLELSSKVAEATAKATAGASKSSLSASREPKHEMSSSPYLPNGRTSGVSRKLPDASTAVPSGAMGTRARNVRVGEGDLAALNDRPWHEALVRAAHIQLCRNRAQVHLRGEGSCDEKHLTALDPASMTREMRVDRPRHEGAHYWVLELCGSFSVAGVALAATLNAKCKFGQDATENTNLTPRFKESQSFKDVVRSNIDQTPESCTVVMRAAGAGHAEIIHALSTENDLSKKDVLKSTSNTGSGCNGFNASSCFVEIREEIDGADLLMDFAETSRQGSRELIGRMLLPLPSVIVLDVVSACGLLRQGALEELASLRLACKHLHAGHDQSQRRAIETSIDESAQLTQPSLPPWPRVVPEVLHLVVVPLECSWLWNQSAVRPDAAPGIDLSPLDNLAVGRFRELPLCFGLPHAQLAVPQVSPASLDLRFEACTSASNQDDSDGQEDDGLARAPSTILHFHVTQVGTLHAFAFWFRQHLYAEGEEGGECEADANPTENAVEREEAIIDTGPSAKNARVQHWRQAAVAVTPPRWVQAGQTLRAVVRFGAGVPGGVDVQMADSE